MSSATFPDGFLRGSATASHQVEGKPRHQPLLAMAARGEQVKGRRGRNVCGYLFVRTPKPSPAWLGDVAARNGLPG